MTQYELRAQVVAVETSDPDGPSVATAPAALKDDLSPWVVNLHTRTPAPRSASRSIKTACTVSGAGGRPAGAALESAGHVVGKARRLSSAMIFHRLLNLTPARSSSRRFASRHALLVLCLTPGF